MNFTGPSAESGRTAGRNFDFGRSYAVRPQGEHRATVVRIHGLGDNGSSSVGPSPWRPYPFQMYVIFCFDVIHAHTSAQYLRLKYENFHSQLLLSPLSLNFHRPCAARTIKTRLHINCLTPNLDSDGLNLKWALRVGPVDQAQTSPKPTIDMDRLVEFLYDDLPHLFDDQGIDRRAYDERVKFRDPITKHDTIAGYLFNIAFLKVVFGPQFYLHWVKQTGPYEITTRWTMVMKFMPLPWKPELIFTGTSIMGINPDTGKFCSHVDYWDSIEKNEYFSLEGLRDVFKQLRIYKTPDLETPKYQILKRTANYEVRRYEPFIVVETNGEKLSGSKGFNDVAGYIFGKNSTQEKIPMTTPVFTQAFDNKLSKVSIQIVLPLEKGLNNLPNPSQEGISLRKVEGGIAAVHKFSGKLGEDVVLEKERKLRTSLEKDGLKPKIGCLLARYNDPGRTWSFISRSEVLIWLEEFELI